jgi:hypothetical protein
MLVAGDITADTYTKIRSDLMRKGLAKLDG